MKKVLSLVLVLTLVLGSFSMAFAAAPNDVVGTEFEDAVERLVGLNIITGYPDGTFGPNDTITREQFAAVVVRAKGLESAALASKGATEFADVAATSWASGYINIASKMGLINGTGSGNFEPLRPVSYEEAIAMVLRALNYEEAALSRGGWPYGYIIVANEVDLLDAVKGVQGLPASRGLVAQLVDNALEIPMMVQIGVGAQALWVVSGTQNTEEVNLLDELGFKNVQGVVSIVDEDDNAIEVGETELVAPEGFDFNFYEGLTIKAWYDGKDNITTFVVKNSAKYDAVVAKDEDTITLVGENKSYDLVEDLEAETADYAKVVLNSDGEVAFVKYYTLDFIVVEEVEDEIVYDLNDQEVNLEDYVITKDGKTITVDDLEVGDILFFDYAKDFAVVYNNSLVGEIERVYSDSVKVSGKVYDLADGVKYLDGTTLDDISGTVLNDMMDEEEDVELFLNHAGDVVLVEGSTGEEVVNTSSFYGFLAADSKAWTQLGRANVKYWTFDVVNEEGKTVKYDLTDNFVSNLDSDDDPLDEGKETFVGGDWYTGEFENDKVADMTANTAVKVTLDEDGEIVKVEKLAVEIADSDFKVTDAKITADNVDYRLQASTLVFYKDASNKNQVIKLGDVDGEFESIDADGDDIELVVSKGRVLVVYAHDNVEGAEETTTSYVGLVSKLRQLTSDKYEFTIEVAGKAEVFVTDDELELTTAQKDAILDHIVEVVVSDETGDMILFGEEGSEAYYNVQNPGTVEVVSRSTTSRTITVTDGTYESTYELNNDAVIYDEDFKVIGLRDLKAEDDIKVFTEGNSDRFVSYVLRVNDVEEEEEEEDALTGTIEFKGILRSNVWVRIDGVEYLYGGELSDLSGLSVGDEVEFEYISIDGDKVLVDVPTIVDAE